MIVKKVAINKTAAAKSKALHVRDLCDYIAGPDAGDRDEKVEHRAAVNLLNLDHDAQVQEMADLADAAKRAPQPVQHWILSWRQGEQPTATQADQAVRIFLNEMGLGQHQAIYALHRDTANCHLHLAVNRVHPEAERVVTVNGGFDIEVAHRAIARIEHEQGWQRERGGRYQVRDQQLVRVDKGTPLQREPTTAARDFDRLTFGVVPGERPASRDSQLFASADSALLTNSLQSASRKPSGAVSGETDPNDFADLSLWARRDSNPLPPASEAGTLSR